MNKSPSTTVHEFLKQLADAAPPDTILKGAEALDSTSQKMNANKGMVVSNSEWDFAPKTSEAGAFDSLVIIGIYYRIPGVNTSKRADARDKCFQMAKAIAEAIYEDHSLGGRVCDTLILRATDGDKSLNNDFYAVINLPVILNPSGARIDFTLGEAE